jgi:hypothetical protein
MTNVIFEVDTPLLKLLSCLKPKSFHLCEPQSYSCLERGARSEMNSSVIGKRPQEYDSSDLWGVPSHPALDSLEEV